MFENDENRPKFDTVTGEPIIYDEYGNVVKKDNTVNETTNTDTTTNATTNTTNEASSTESSQYRYSDNNIPYATREGGYSQSPGYEQNNQYNANKKPEKKPKKPAGFVKKAVALVLSAAVFGVVAGGVAYGTYYTAGRLVPTITGDYSNVEIPTVSTSGIADSTSSIINESTATTTGIMDVQKVVNAAMPAIVAINGKVTTTTSAFGYPYQTESTSSGTGIIVGKNDTELLIVTNAHVVDGVNSLSVTFTDDEAVAATVKGSKSDKDVAVVAVSLADMKSSTISSIAMAELGDSDSVQVGEQVVAIGNALGEGQSVTVGWISALNRTITIENTTYSNLFMTDAAINPGNSGGALLNSNGQVIGINSAKYASSEIEGMGYAIPISSVRDIIDNLMNRVTRTKVDESKASFLGISGMDVTSSMSSTYGYPQGIVIQTVESGSAAESAGLQKYDILVAFDDVDITSFTTLQNTMQYYAAGEEVEIQFYHLENGQYVLKTASVTLGQRK